MLKMEEVSLDFNMLLFRHLLNHGLTYQYASSPVFSPVCALFLKQYQGFLYDILLVQVI